MKFGKSLFVISTLLLLSACGTNPATGKNQFAGLMSPRQEVEVGASEHSKIAEQYGFYQDQKLQSYVNEIGKRVTAQTERPDVNYQFFVIDSPVVNAFALPGGYIYVSRGLLALANSEAELAAVMAHETGHITARHSAERYSHSVLTSLGAAVLSAAVDNGGLTQALGVGSNLYLSSYSRGQEAEADSLGLRYMTRGGYDPAAMPSFLASLQQETVLESKGNSGQGEAFSYFSTHPATGDRVNNTRAESQKYQPGGDVSADKYLALLDGMIYGDSAHHGYVRGQTFYHPDMGFAFTVPAGFKINNLPDQIAAVSPSGAVILFDIAANPQGLSPSAYMAQSWLKGASTVPAIEDMSVNNMAAATTGFAGNVNGKAADLRLVAINWQGKIARFQVAIPKGTGSAQLDEIKKATYSFHSLTGTERASLKPQRVKIVTAGAGDTIQSLAARQPFGNLNVDRFRVLNALTGGQSVQAGKKYKIIVE